jgi:peptide-methionine (R)-S-oxide reductase
VAYNGCMPAVRQVNPNLSEAQKKVLLERDTEAPFTGAFLHNKGEGAYTCANCGAVLFDSSTKFDSGSGWPSFNDVAASGAVTLSEDNSHGMQRTEATCANCGGHLGHVFEDAPRGMPTPQRYCINSCALDFKEKK